MNVPARKGGKRSGGTTTPLAIGIIAIIIAISSFGYAYVGTSSQLSNVQNQLGTVQSQQDSQKSAIDALKSTLTSLSTVQSQLDSLKKALSSLAQQSSVTDLQSTVSSLTTQISSLKASLASAQAQVDSLTAAAKQRQTTPQSREFWVVTAVLDFNETTAGIPHDTFYPSHLVVNQGDNVTIHFYNTENEPEHHNLIISAYNINVDLGQGQNKDITFTANKAGTFVFLCSYHQPTMRGELVVLPSS